eukprot:9467760-Pyramimonas_sp.AAC.1
MAGRMARNRCWEKASRQVRPEGQGGQADGTKLATNTLACNALCPRILVMQFVQLSRLVAAACKNALRLFAVWP